MLDGRQKKIDVGGGVRVIDVGIEGMKALEILSPPVARLRYANDGLPVTSSYYLSTTYGFAQGTMRAIGTRLLDRRPKRGPASWPDFNALLRRPDPLHDRLLRLPPHERPDLPEEHPHLRDHGRLATAMP